MAESIIFFDSYTSLTKSIADDVYDLIAEAENLLLCTASGDTPTGI